MGCHLLSCKSGKCITAKKAIGKGMKNKKEYNVGYACMHYDKWTEWSKDRLTTGRTIRKLTFDNSQDQLIDKCVHNLRDLEIMLRWNQYHGISLLRISHLFPWFDRWNFSDLTLYNKERLERQLNITKESISKHNVRITSHPGQYVCLASPKSDVIKNSIADLESHGKLFDILELEKSPWNKINIHVGGSYERTYEETAKRFINSFNLLSDSVKSRLTLENDDSPNCWSVSLLYYYITKNINIPIVFDSLHWEYGPKTNEIDKSYEMSLKLALKTWEKKPIVHHSESASNERKGVNPTSHSQYYTKSFNTCNYDNIHIMLECKAKESATLKYINDFLNDKKDAGNNSTCA